MTDFLLELRSEEIPARMQAGARESLARLFAGELAKAGLVASETVTYATPRRLALIARGLPDTTEPVREEVKGPKVSAPPQALEGFLRKTGLTRDQLEDRGGVLFAVTEKPGRATAEVLAEAIPAVIRAFPWPKSMRWGAASISSESLRWVRPLQGIVALFGEEVVPCEVAGIVSGATTLGHRFHHPGPITIGSAADYVEKLRMCHVVVDQDERLQIIALGATMAANKAGLKLVRDEGLLIENAGLTEWPVPLLGRFDEAFLDVPPEVIQLTARVNQKYFVCRDAENRLANAFVCTANIDASDGGATIVEGNRKVLAARLSDARFFYETDLKVPLDEQPEKLAKIVFHEKLGTVADKVDRVAKLARWLVEEGIVQPAPSPPVGEGRGPLATASGKGEGDGASDPIAPPPHPSADFVGSLQHRVDHAPRDQGHAGGMTDPMLPQGERERLATLAERAAYLCKADLITGMVGEFPELQGLMGGYYALAQGEDPQVAAAIRDHYKPVGQGDEVPTAPVTVAVSLADKLDTLVLFFAADMPPTGSKDPFALRRSALGLIALIAGNRLRIGLERLLRAPLILAYDIQSVRSAVDAIGIPLTIASLPFRVPDDEVSASFGRAFFRLKLQSFILDRLKVQQREAGVRHDLIDAVFALGGEDDLVRLLARVRALQAFVGTEDGANLLAGYKRAANILKKEGWVAPSPLVGEERRVGHAPGMTSAAWGAADPALGPLAQASGKGEGDASGPTITPPHPSAASPLPPSPTGGEGFAPAESALLAALDAAEPAAADAVVQEDFEAAMTALATLRAPIDAFFESVTVNDPDPATRERRLALLARVRAAVHGVADFSKIEG